MEGESILGSLSGGEAREQPLEDWENWEEGGPCYKQCGTRICACLIAAGVVELASHSPWLWKTGGLGSVSAGMPTALAGFDLGSSIRQKNAQGNKNNGEVN